MAYHVLIDDSPRGPFETATIDRMIRDGEIDRETYVWTAGMADWAFADSVPEIAALLRAAAAPLPTPDPTPPDVPSPRGAASAARPDDPAADERPVARRAASGRLSVGRALGGAVRVLFESPVRTVLFAVPYYAVLVAATPGTWAALFPELAGLAPLRAWMAAGEGSGPRGHAPWLAVGGKLVSFIVLAVFWGGLCASMLAMARDRPVRVALLFSGVRRAASLVAFMVLAAAMCAVGAAVFVLPGLFLLVCLAPGPLAVMDRGAGPLAAISGSFRMVLDLGWFRCFAALLVAACVGAAAFAAAGWALLRDTGFAAEGAAGEAGGAAWWFAVFVAPPLTTILLFNAAAMVWHLFTAGVLASIHEQGRAGR